MVIYAQGGGGRETNPKKSVDQISLDLQRWIFSPLAENFWHFWHFCMTMTDLLFPNQPSTTGDKSKPNFVFVQNQRRISTTNKSNGFRQTLANSTKVPKRGMWSQYTEVNQCFLFWCYDCVIPPKTFPFLSDATIILYPTKFIFFSDATIILYPRRTFFFYYGLNAKNSAKKQSYRPKFRFFLYERGHAFQWLSSFALRAFAAHCAFN